MIKRGIDIFIADGRIRVTITEIGKDSNGATRFLRIEKA